ncbi:hypothetical protein L7F22_042254 [Adiantum nelumboides]|nr:hypothetical protein [Adiantum nelumboides]
MAMAATTLKNGKSNPPSLRQQLKFIKTIYQTLTNVYFLLIEQGASTSIASTKNALTIQMTSLKAQIRGEILEQASTSRSQTPSGLQPKPSTGGLSDLRPEHSKRIKDIHLFEVLLRPNVGTKGSISSNSTQNAFLPSLKQAIQAIEVINEILNELMERANVHAANQARIRELVADIEQRNTTMVKSIRKLAILRESCHRLVKLGKEEEESIKRAESKPLAYDDILHYARTLSQTTTAPPGFKLQFDEEGERSHDVDPVDAQSGDQPVKKRKLFQLADDDDDEAEAGKNGQIPSHLQDKLPFPSIDAIRRGASVIRPPTWDMFQKGILQMDQEEVDGNPETDVQLAEYTRTSTSASKPQPRKPQPVEEEEDGFGLDLN